MHEYVRRCNAIKTGVGVLKIDDKIELWTRSATGVGFQIDGHRDIKANSTIIIKAKLNDKYVCPRKLKNRKVFYRFYTGKDKNGINRRYLYLAARSNDFVYRGSRLIMLTRSNGASLLLEKSLRERLNILRKDYYGGYQPDFSADNLAAELFPEEGY